MARSTLRKENSGILCSTQSFEGSRERGTRSRNL